MIATEELLLFTRDRPRRHRRAPTSTRRSSSTSATFGMRCVHEEINEEQGVREAMLAVGDSGVLHPAARAADPGLDDREVPRPQRARASSRSPTRVDDVEAAATALRAAGVRLLYDEPRSAARPARLVNFCHPKDAGGRAGRAGRGRQRDHGMTDVRMDGRSATPSSPTRPHERTFAALADSRVRTAAITVHKDEAGDVRGHGLAGQGPAPVAAPRRGADPRARARRGARRRDGVSAINYNTVWTSHLRAGLDVRLPRAVRPTSHADAKRHDLPYHVIGSDLSGVVLRIGPGVQRVEAGRRGRRALPVVELEIAGWAQRHDARPRAADLGLRDELRRPRRARRWSRPTSCCPSPPT